MLRGALRAVDARENLPSHIRRRVKRHQQKQRLRLCVISETENAFALKRRRVEKHKNGRMRLKAPRAHTLRDDFVLWLHATRRFFSLFLHRPGACSSQPSRVPSEQQKQPTPSSTVSFCNPRPLISQPHAYIATLKNYKRVPFKIRRNAAFRRCWKRKTFVRSCWKKTWAETAEIKGHKSSNVIKMDGVIWCWNEWFVVCLLILLVPQPSSGGGPATMLRHQPRALLPNAKTDRPTDRRPHNNKAAQCLQLLFWCPSLVGTRRIKPRGTLALSALEGRRRFVLISLIFSASFWRKCFSQICIARTHRWRGARTFRKIPCRVKRKVSFFVLCISDDICTECCERACVDEHYSLCATVLMRLWMRESVWFRDFKDGIMKSANMRRSRLLYHLSQHKQYVVVLIWNIRRSSWTFSQFLCIFVLKV